MSWKLDRAARALALMLGLSAAQAYAAGADMQVAYLDTHNIYRSGLKGTHTVALTFDDGPNAYTPGVLDALAAAHVKATFFIVGKMAAARPDILERIAAEGHLLANHSATHPFLGRRYDEHPELLLSQVRDVDDMITPLEPGDPKFFRAPYGGWRPDHARILNADPELSKYIGPVYWDEGGQVRLSQDDYIMSASDWGCWRRGWDAETCAKGYVREIWRNDGGVVLMHCIHKESAALVAAVVPKLQADGFRLIRLDQVPEYRHFESPPIATEPVLRAARRS